MSLALLLLLPILSLASAWEEGSPVPPGGRPNPLNLPQAEFEEYRSAGRLHALSYPVEITGILVPYEPVTRLLEPGNRNPFMEFLRSVFAGVTDISSFTALTAWLGLHPYPKKSDEGAYSVPFPGGQRPDHLMGLTFLERGGAKGFTFSCAACHSASLFGKTVLGMGNRFPRANEFFLHGHRAQAFASPKLFKVVSGATAGETKLYQELKASIRRVGVRAPATLGLDTSLAQVALSLARREPDSYATPSRRYERFPRPEPLSSVRADSKPAPWWNVKYKNRFLLDGSVVSGNPIFTNLLWNEIGRGTDLRELELWLERNQRVVDELTTAVFSAESPRFTDFFPPSAIPLESAKRGEKVFNRTCARCHGVYEKAWNLPEAGGMSLVDLLQTTLVRYPEQTKVMNVGTDPLRARAMDSLEQLNDLAISQANGTLIRPQAGYVPPPLVGIWARWPYFHNNSAPSLCAVLTRGSNRPVRYYAGEAEDRERDFDRHCNGYPSPAPKSWEKREYLYNSQRPGMSRLGHDEGIFLKNGKEILSPSEKRDLVRFLQTL